MKSIYLLLILSLVFTVKSEPIKVPLFRKRTDFISASASTLYNGVLGGQVQIGNPPQNFTLAFDTTTGYTWVRGTNCDGENCLGRSAYEAKNSTTARSTGQNFRMRYGQSTVSSKIYQDTFRYSGLEVKNMPFGNAYCMKRFDRGFDGFIGLGRSINLNRNMTVYSKRDIPASGFVPTAYQQGSGVSSSQFGMYTTSGGPGFYQDSQPVSHTTSSMDPITTTNAPTTTPNTMNSATSITSPDSHHTTINSNDRPTGASSGIASGGWGSFSKRSFEEPAGYLILGGIDTDAIKGQLQYIEASEDNGSGHWALPVRHALFVNDLRFEVKEGAEAVLSTSTDVIGLPNKQADEFKKHWYAEYDAPDNTYMIPCCLMNKLKKFQIQLGTLKITLPPHYWSHPRETETCCEMCRTHIGRSDSEKDYLLGYSFTNAFYTQFDDENNRVGFALKKDHKEDGLKLCQKGKK